MTIENYLEKLLAKSETEGGSYFVSNYPLYASWSSEHNAAFIESLKIKDPKPSGVYVHIPFCRKRCRFCYFKVYTDKKPEEINYYIKMVKSELEQWNSKKYLAALNPTFMYFGGGTPSFLSTQNLTELFSELYRYFDKDKFEEITFECEPGTLSERKLDVLKENGVTRLSIGVENFTDEILVENGRAHKSKEIYRAYEYARKIGFEQINIDLIAGMIGETDENWKLNIEKLSELSPDSVTIYQMEIPYNTKIYKEMKTEGCQTAPVANWDKKREWLSLAFDELLSKNYVQSSAYTLVKKENKKSFVYRDNLWNGADLLGVGVSSFGHLNGYHYQNNSKIEEYEAIIAEDHLAVNRSYKVSKEEFFIREFVLQLKKGYLKLNYFKSKFGFDASVYFAEQIKVLTQFGFLKLLKDEITLTRDGLLRIDLLLSVFFEEKYRSDK